MRMTSGLKRFVIGGLMAVAVLAAGGGAAFAATNNSVTSGDSDKTIYKFGSNVTINGTVNGDIICAGQNINIDANVTGDIICAGQTINIHGQVSGNVRVAGQTVNINATVMNNASLAGMDISLSPTSNIGRDVMAAGQTLTVEGVIGRDYNAAGGDLFVNGPIGRNVIAQAGQKLVLQKGAVIGGTLEYTSPVMVQKDNGAQVSGTVTYHKQKEQKDNNGAAIAALIGFAFIWRLYWLVAMSIFGLILVALFPQMFRKWNKVAVKSTGWAFLAGFIAMFAVPIAIVISFVSIVGVPIGIFLILAWLLILMLTLPVATYYAASQVFPKMHPVLGFFVASLILLIFTLIPIIGGMLSFVIYLFGTGVLLLNLKDGLQRPDYKPAK